MVLRYLLALLMLPLFALSITAQEQHEQANIFLNPSAPQNCEQNIVSMEVLATRTLEQTKGSRVLVAIARLGDGEKSRESNRRRLYNVREFLKDRAGIEAEKIVAAEGEQVCGLGRVEFYLDGKMVGRLLLARNKDLCLICCDEYGPYYPHKDNSENKDKDRRQTRAPMRRQQ